MKSTNLEQVVIQIHNVMQISAMLKMQPKDAEFIAINKHKWGSIFYKENKGVLYADFLNGEGWKRVKQSSLEDLKKALLDISFLLVRIDLLEKEIELTTIKNGINLNKFHLLEQHISTRIESVELRRDDGNENYWNGCIDAYDTVKHMIKKIAEIA